MKKFTIELTAEDNPDAVGELLRSRFFKAGTGEVGCYSTFEWQEDVEPLPPLPVSEHNHKPGEESLSGEGYCDGCLDPDSFYTRGQKDGIECRWFWDGDGLLAFKIPGEEEWLFNTDCKNDHGWQLEKELW